MSESATHSIREAMRHNCINMGELGKYIRIEHVENILDRYIIMGKNADAELELGRIQEIRNLLTDPSNPENNDRALLSKIWQIVGP